MEEFTTSYDFYKKALVLNQDTEEIKERMRKIEK